MGVLYYLWDVAHLMTAYAAMMLLKVGTLVILSLEALLTFLFRPDPTSRDTFIKKVDQGCLPTPH